jgi:hypothetical protein
VHPQGIVEEIEPDLRIYPMGGQKIQGLGLVEERLGVNNPLAFSTPRRAPARARPGRRFSRPWELRAEKHPQAC